MTESLLAEGELHFSVEARLLRELGERLVRRPETALIELIKNSYDADAKLCTVQFKGKDALSVTDDGVGMTFDEFESGWMRIGTAVKAGSSTTRRFERPVTGEKGIGRFSVRFLGERLSLKSVAFDAGRGIPTRLEAEFDWPSYDATEDLGKVSVPYRLTAAEEGVAFGTELVIRKLRPSTREVDLKDVRTASIGLISPLRSLLAGVESDAVSDEDPGFRLVLGDLDEESDDVAAKILDAYTLRAVLVVGRKRLTLEVYAKGSDTPYLSVSDAVPAKCGEVRADIRFFPRRGGAFKGLPVDGRLAYTWVRENSGVVVFDRSFRVPPYGERGDDWLSLTADAARNLRKPRSSLALKHFPMSDAEQASTAENWMLRLPEAAQLIGVVQVTGSRTAGRRAAADGEGLVAAADREGFVANDAFAELVDHVRGAVEAIAAVDRRRQREQQEAERQRRLQALEADAARAIASIEKNPNLPAAEKHHLVNAISRVTSEAAEHERETRERVRQLEVMSLLGVVAGFMTHEFGIALDELNRAHRVLLDVKHKVPEVEKIVVELAKARDRLEEFAEYSRAYINASRSSPPAPYKALPRLRLVRRKFGRYAEDRNIDVRLKIDPTLPAPLVPTALYDGVALNLFTNALKAVSALSNPRAERLIEFRAWNERDQHVLQVNDTGHGIPSVLRDRVFDPLFTTTEERSDPLGSGMGLGLSLVRASVEAFDGLVGVVDPPTGFSTCVEVRLPLDPEDDYR